ncbi:MULTISPECIES: hypothetical protein [Photorhabdus]|uniref:Uncharacterized protein n=2 Tax=Photorhabdus asymbiotica TaxID=291112 RepID=B6VM57_PHOAA|nr:hypothetical protein [Photorhabdus asymbiotica]RKS54488.1 hypothetical protein BDD30_4063 [Photorhabdus asymbiotica]CAQ82350.1 conserved hypothetical protein [Photorhabdus asymbiotica]CAR67237.1 hypothetical protein PA-RVA11-2292 [Photorhabdus asymbiotica subsp. asymbiotica ATCC 43949]
MTKQRISPPAGSACMTCNNPNPCLCEVSVTFEKKTQVWPKKPSINMNLVDNGKGQIGTIKITEKCDHAKHQAKLHGGPKEKTLKFNTPEKVTLFYKEELKSIDIQNGLKSVASYLSNIANPTDMYKAPRYYKLEIKACTGSRKYATIAVYPSVRFMVSVGFSFNLSYDKRSIKERRDEQIKARQAMENVKPKNGNKLRKGWTTRTDEFSLTRETKLKVEYALTVQDKDYSTSFINTKQAKETRKDLDAISLAEKLLGYTKKYLVPAPGSKGKASQNYELLNLKLTPSNIGLAYAYDRTTSVEDSTHFVGFYAAPLMGMTAKLDLIQLGATYCKIEFLAAKFRQALERKNANDKNYLELECCLIVTCDLSFQLGAAYKSKQWTFDAGNKNNLKLSLEGKVSAAFKQKILIVEIALNAKGTIKTAAGFQFDQHNKGIDLVGYHNGITAEIELSADAEIGRKKKASKKAKNKWTWVIADPLKASESPLRINVLGKERPITVQK